jgi:MazG family protein
MDGQDAEKTEKNGSETERAAGAVKALLALMARLRDPEHGCPWDVDQTFATIAPYTIEEAYEVADAIERGAHDELKSELGDLLFQVVFHARMAEEWGLFDFTDVAEALVAKMTVRHPHVFGGAEMRNAEEQTHAWEKQKAEERAAKGVGVLDDVPLALPALMRAEKLTRRAGRIGFDWPNAEAVLDKLDEELAELRDARAHGDAAHIAEEMGDILFVTANLARKLGVDAEETLRRANAKFVRRFTHMEAALRAAGKSGAQPLDELEALWTAAKNAERRGK